MSWYWTPNTLLFFVIAEMLSKNTRICCYIMQRPLQMEQVGNQIQHKSIQPNHSGTGVLPRQTLMNGWNFFQSTCNIECPRTIHSDLQKSTKPFPHEPLFLLESIARRYKAIYDWTLATDLTTGPQSVAELLHEIIETFTKRKNKSILATQCHAVHPQRIVLHRGPDNRVQRCCEPCRNTRSL